MTYLSLTVFASESPKIVDIFIDTDNGTGSKHRMVWTRRNNITLAKIDLFI